MAKYVRFNFKDKESTYYKVNDFTLENIKKLPSYNEQWLGMTFLDGKMRTFEGKILDIYPAKLIKKIYYGKKISFKEVVQIIGNDLKYKDLLWQMENLCRTSFINLNLNISDAEEYNKKYELYKKDFYKKHYCLFTLPNNFFAYPLEEDNSITIEEFDNNINLDYDVALKNIQMNYLAGKKYIEENQFLLEIFNNYFQMLIKSYNSHPNNIALIFNICPFHFERIQNLSTLDEINFFLDICNYTYGFTNSNKNLFKIYRNFINNQYKTLDGEENISL